MRLFLRLLLILLLIAVAVIGVGYWAATREPVVRETRVAVADWPQGAPPVRILLASDLQVSGPDMPPERVRDIVAQINALAPDIILLAGDFISEKPVSTSTYSFPEIARPLAALEAPLGVHGVLGNHDHWSGAQAAREALGAAGINMLANEALRAGPLAIGGLGDPTTGHARLEPTLEAMRGVGGVPVLLTHSPDPFVGLPGWVRLTLAGHTHCGQIRLPLIGPVATVTEHGERYACGRVDEDGRTLIVSAGLGTSIVPLRIGARPDVWLITIGPAAGGQGTN